MTDTIAGQMEKQLERVKEVVPRQDTHATIEHVIGRYCFTWGEKEDSYKVRIYVEGLPNPFFYGATFKEALAKLKTYYYYEQFEREMTYD